MKLRSSSAFQPIGSAVFFVAVFFMSWMPRAWAQQPVGSAQSVSAPSPLITQSIDESRLTVLKGNTHPLARPQFDLGTAPATLPMQRMLLVLKRGAAQELALRKLLDSQQDKSSPSYHKWLMPEEYGKEFGPTDADIQTITGWLQSHGFQVGATKGRTVLEFSGSASQVQEAFHTTIHKYVVNEEQHWANSSDPSIPTALTPAVAGVLTLHNFPRHPMSVVAGKFSRDKATGKLTPLQPEYTFPSGCVESNSSNSPCFYGLGPYDFATIYNVLPLWNSGVNGTGQSIAIVGETNINIQDISDFRSLFGLTANNPQVILNGPDPGIQADETEADLDLEWSGAVAPNATIDFVVSQSTETTAGIDLSAVYIIDNNLAPVMSESYGGCELALGTAGNQFYNALWEQAASQGITVFISAGDNGSAGCDNFDAHSPAPAEFGLQVSGFASTPYNVAVGGTDFNDFSNPATYWSTTNNSTTQASAKSYIPETTWNSSCTNAIFGTVGYSTNPETNCNDSRITPYFDVPLGGSGGMSACTTPSGLNTGSCSGGYTKPSWQTGTGVPNDGKRDIPDVSLFASNGFLNNFYIICQSDVAGPCSLQSPYTSFLGIGGTSASSPAFAGIMALVNQQTGERQGNANYVFYKLAAKQSDASCNSSNGSGSSCVFNDVTSGTNEMPCAAGSPNCTTSAGDQYGILTGYNAGTGYDLATGLGSVNANNLVTQWNSANGLPSTTTLNSLTPTTITHGQPVTFSVTVKPQSGTGTPTGEISLEGPSIGDNQSVGAFNLTSGSFSGTTDLLPGGTYSVTAHYPGDATYAASDSSPINVTVNKENSQAQIFLVTFDSSGNVVSPNTNTAVYGSPYVLRVNMENSAATVCAPVNTTTPTACPSGTVAMTDNGATLDAGTYTLNSYGYFEDNSVQLPGGTDSVKAAYAGDSSFNASTTTSAITITAAVSFLNAPTVATYGVGNAFSATAIVQSLSSGVPPTGTVTFLSNGTPVTGTTTYQPGTQAGSPAVAFVTANFTSTASAFPKPGNYSITASYGGDENYGPVTSSDTQVTVLYPAPFSSVNPYSQDVNPGTSASITAFIDSQNKNIYPTGNITVYNPHGVVLAGPTSCTNAKDSNGNYACQATTSFTVSATISLNVVYSGDANYPATYTPAEVVVNDFTIGPDSSSIFNVTQGQSLGVQIDIGDSGTFNGTVSNFTCSGLPAGTTCSFSPLQVAGSGSTALTIATTPLGQVRRGMSHERRGVGLGATAMLPLLGVFLIAIPSWRRRKALPMLLIAFFLVLPSCGGGSGSNGGGSSPPANNPVPSITSISPTQQAAGSVAQLLTITGTGFVGDSNATYNSIAHATTYVSATQVTITLASTDMATTGSYPILVTNPAPGGGASSAVDFAVVTGTPTGSSLVTVTASSGSLVHSTNFTLNVNP
jgi:Pro-kumamolisin, activation domain/Bacterial Ig-like domain (group 3)